MSKRLGGIKGCKYKTSSWHLSRFPDADNIGSLKKYELEDRNIQSVQQRYYTQYMKTVYKILVVQIVPVPTRTSPTTFGAAGTLDGYPIQPTARYMSIHVSN